jgi:hypothetical protein
MHPERWTEYPIGAKFLIGQNDEQYGQDFSRLDGPRYESGFLPIVVNRYKHGDATIAQEAFVPVDSALADHAAVLVRLRVEGSHSATPLSIEIEAKTLPVARDGMLVDASGRCLAWFGDGWGWDASRKRLSASLASDQPRFVAILSKPLESPALGKLDDGTYQAHRKRCEAEWTRRIAQCAAIEVPEDVVNRAWKSLIVANLMMAVGDEMRYSAGNQYARLFEAESGDALRSLLVFGCSTMQNAWSIRCWHTSRKGFATMTLRSSSRCSPTSTWITRDAEFVRSRVKQWRPSVDIIPSEAREGERPPAQGELLRRHRDAGLLAELQRQRLASAARRRRHASRYGRRPPGRADRDRGRDVPRGDPQGDRQERSARLRSAVHSGRAARC